MPLIIKLFLIKCLTQYTICVCHKSPLPPWWCLIGLLP